MTSAVDTTFPSDDEKVSKADWRAQNLIINNEITALQQKVMTGYLAYHSIVSAVELPALVRRYGKANLARDMAFGRVSLNPANN